MGLKWGKGEGGGSIPEVVVEIVGAGFVGLVGEDDAGTAVVVLAVGVRDETFLGWAVGHLGRVAWSRVAVRVRDQDAFVAVRRGALRPSQSEYI